MFSVYCHENKANGKVYIGITSQDAERRWLNGRGYKKNKKFNDDIERFGWESFDHRIIADNLSQEQAVAIEHELITAYDARHLGYNNDDGGKYVSKRALCHEANEIRRGIISANLRYIGGAKDLVDCLEMAESEGKESNFCKGVNMAVQTIIETFQKDKRPIQYTNVVFLADFVWEWNRYWRISKFVQLNGKEEAMRTDFNELFPKYNSPKKYEFLRKD